MVRPNKTFTRAAQNYICVRITNINDVDFKLYPFDYDLTMAIMLSNADGTVYHRYGGRTNISPMNIKTLVNIMDKGLASHKQYLKKPNPPKHTPQRLSTLIKTNLKDKMKPVHGCYHCHYAREAQQYTAVKNGTWKPDQFWIWPSSKRLGIEMDQENQQRIKRIISDSPAALAGLKAGDILNSLKQKPVLTKYDIQWILNQNSEKKGSLGFTATRSGKPLQGTLKLAKAWKVGDPNDYAWRVNNIYTQHMNKFLPTPGFIGKQVKNKNLPPRLSPGDFALKVTHLNYGTYLAGIRVGDVILSAAGKRDFKDLRAFFHHCEILRLANLDIKMQILRQGKEMNVMVNLNYLNYLEVEKSPKIALGFMPQEMVGDRGLRVGLVTDGSNAERSGLEHGDFIETVDGKAVTTFVSMRERMADKAPGDMLRISVLRQEKKMQFAYMLVNKDKKSSTLVKLSAKPERNGQEIECRIHFKLPKTQHIYSIHRKGFGVPSQVQFRGQGYELLGSIIEPAARKIVQAGNLLPMYVISDDFYLTQRIRITDIKTFRLFMQVYAQICDDKHCHEFRAFVINDGSETNFSQFLGRFENHPLIKTHLKK